MTSCSVIGCVETPYAHGLCSRHYQRLRRLGSTEDRKGSHGLTLSERLWRDVEKGDSCWAWTGFKRKGYGSLWLDGANVRAHRASWILAHGPIPAGINVLHACDNPACVRPSHLFLGTHADNVADRHAKGRDGHADRRGEKAGRAKLTEPQVIEIRASKDSDRAIAGRFNVDPSTISDIRRRKTWAHLPP